MLGAWPITARVAPGPFRAGAAKMSGMPLKSLRIAAALVLCGALAAPAGAAPVAEPDVVVEESALASWMFPTDQPGHSKWIFAGAYRTAIVGGGTTTFGFAVKGSCEQRARGHTSCSGTGIERELPEAAFEMDPALRDAAMAIGRRHMVSWRADNESPVALYVAGEACTAGKGVGAGGMQHAAASGTVFGRELSRAGIDHAILARGVMATECARPLLDALTAGRPVRVVFAR